MGREAHSFIKDAHKAKFSNTSLPQMFEMLFICELVGLVQNLKVFIEEFLEICLEKIGTDADKKWALTVAQVQTCKHLTQLRAFAGKLG